MADHAVITGPIQRELTLPDGTSIDCSPAVVYVDTPEQAAALAHEIGLHYKYAGHPNVEGSFEYVEPVAAPVVADAPVEVPAEVAPVVEVSA